MSFKLVAATDTNRTAAEATELSAYNASSNTGDLDFGALQYLETKVIKFKIANTGASKGTFTITILSDNTGLATNTTISTDGNTYSTSAIVYVRPNRVSEVLYLKHYVNVDTAGIAKENEQGTIKIKVVEA